MKAWLISMRPRTLASNALQVSPPPRGLTAVYNRPNGALTGRPECPGSADALLPRGRHDVTMVSSERNGLPAFLSVFRHGPPPPPLRRVMLPALPHTGG